MVCQSFSPAPYRRSGRGLVLIGTIERIAEPAGRELLTEAGARALAERLQRFWVERGFEAARFTAEQVIARKRGGCAAVWAVQSNLVNGVPPRKPRAAPVPASDQAALQGTARRVLEAMAGALADGERVTHAAIAKRVGLVSGTVANVLAGLKDGGFVANAGRTTGSRWVVLRDAEGRPEAAKR